MGVRLTLPAWVRDFRDCIAGGDQLPRTRPAQWRKDFREKYCCMTTLSLRNMLCYLVSLVAVAIWINFVLLLCRPDVGRTASIMNSCSNPPLKVYMYDMPRKYNVGVLMRDEIDEDVPWGDEELPPWPASPEERWDLNTQHSVEYHMMQYLLESDGDRKDAERAAVRVREPERADVFFVPFFASLAFNNYGYSMEKGHKPDYDKQLQEGVKNFLLTQSEWWNASHGHDHVIAIHHPNAFRHERQILNSSTFIVADFGRLEPDVARLSKDVVAPYEHVVNSNTMKDSFEAYAGRPYLLYFRGRVSRKDEGIVRVKLMEQLMNEKDVQFVDGVADSKGFAEATKGMQSSRFCLHPAGDTPSSCRLFDAIVSHCVPVIVSDKIELPFEDEIDYSQFALFFSFEDVDTNPGHLLRTLRGIDGEQLEEMWTKLKAVSHHFEFQHPAMQDDAVEMIFKQLRRKLPSIKRAVHRSNRLRMPYWTW